MILADFEIEQMCKKDPPLVERFLPENIQPASLDVRLGYDFKVFERDATPYIDLSDPADITKHVEVREGSVFMLHPGEIALGVTIERVNMPDNMVARIEGKSSLGRLGLIVHMTAGFIDPGFRGPITLEMTGLHPLPLALRPGMLIAQLSFQCMNSHARRPYQGRYQDAQGVESSKYGKSQQDIELERMSRAVEGVDLSGPDHSITGGFRS